MRPACLLLCLICLALSACKIDPNEGFVPGTAIHFFLVEEGVESRSILRLDANGYQENWQSQLGLNSDEVSDLDIGENRLWIGSGSRKELIVWDLSRNEQEGRYATGDLSPHQVSVGDRYVLIADSLQQRMAFIKVKNGELEYAFSRSPKPRFSRYRSAKFFTVLGDSLVAIYQEQAFAVIDSVVVSGRIRDIQADESNFMYTYSWDTSLISTRINYNSNQATSVDRLALDQVLHSPFLRQQVGTEWLEDVYIQDQSLFTESDNEALATEVNSAEMDFFSGRLFYQSQDSLKSLQLPDRSHFPAYPLFKKIHRAVYYRDFIGE